MILTQLNLTLFLDNSTAFAAFQVEAKRMASMN